jgi:hypothetical protein
MSKLAETKPLADGVEPIEWCGQLTGRAAKHRKFRRLPASTGANSRVEGGPMNMQITKTFASLGQAGAP